MNALIILEPKNIKNERLHVIEPYAGHRIDYNTWILVQTLTQFHQFSKLNLVGCLKKRYGPDNVKDSACYIHTHF